MVVMLDHRGTRIEAGDFIAWATRVGNSGCINAGTVESIKDDKIHVVREKGGRKVYLSDPDRIVVIKKRE